MNNNLIYCLKCPFTQDVHYIGKSSVGLIRPMSHLSQSHSDKIREWVEDIGKLGYSPIVAVLENNIEPEQLDDKEKYWVAKYIKEGAILLNKSLVSYSSIINLIIENQEKDLENSDSVINEVSQVVKNIRKKSKLSQEDLSGKLGIGLKWLRKLEQCDNNIMLSNLESFLRNFNLRLKIEKIK